MMDELPSGCVIGRPDHELVTLNVSALDVAAVSELMRAIARLCDSVLSGSHAVLDVLERG